jgi:hypothetical protein
VEVSSRVVDATISPMPSGVSDEESKWGLRVLQAEIVLLTAVPAIICAGWILFLHRQEARELFRPGVETRK